MDATSKPEERLPQCCQEVAAFERRPIEAPLSQTVVEATLVNKGKLRHHPVVTCLDLAGYGMPHYLGAGKVHPFRTIVGFPRFKRKREFKAGNGPNGVLLS